MATWPTRNAFWVELKLPKPERKSEIALVSLPSQLA